MALGFREAVTQLFKEVGRFCRMASRGGLNISPRLSR